MTKYVIYKLALVSALVALMFATGCNTISKQAKEQISVEANSRAADWREWDKLDDLKRRESAFLSAKASAELNYSVNGVPIPPEFKLAEGEPQPDDRKPLGGH